MNKAKPDVTVLDWKEVDSWNFWYYDICEKWRPMVFEELNVDQKK